MAGLVIGETPYPRDYPGWEGAVETELIETGADGQARMTQLALGTQEPDTAFFMVETAYTPE